MKKKCPICKECLDPRVSLDGTLEFRCYLCGKVYRLDLDKGLVLKGVVYEGN